ncbi:MAG: transposase [Clostridia bacterium]|nr:transposase [Clostridia bacterium]
MVQKEFPNRKNLRLKGFDYNSIGAYFITICTHKRHCTLSHIVGAIHESPETRLTEYGKTVDKIIGTVSDRFKIKVDGYVIMPNHVHLIVVITDEEELRAIRESPLRSRSLISKTIGYLKMNVSKEINNRFCKTKVWQRGFHDHIIRNRKDYEKIAKYIHENPLRWESDCFYSECSSDR